MNVIELITVKKDYPLGATTVHAVRGVDLAIKQGDFVSIIGPSGSGKTTLLNIIGCIDHASDGTVNINGQDVTTMNDRELTNLRLHTIGFIFQTFNLIPVLSARENVEFPLLIMKKEKLSKKEIRERAEKMIEEVGLRDQIEQKPYELSGGQRQRVAIARALVTKPAIVLADEPTANLDSVSGRNVLALFREIAASEGRAVLVVTHDARIIEQGDRVMHLVDGHLDGEGDWDK
jgi:putative ABC transport system ATP-binding protein